MKNGYAALGLLSDPQITYVHHTLRVSCAPNAVYVAARERVYDFDRIVAKSSTNNAFAFSVEREMIDATSYVR